MRPNSIIMFERLYLGSLLVGLINLFLSYDQTLAQLNSDPAMAQLGWGGGALIGMFAFSVAITLLLWYFIARRGSVIAKWFVVAFVVIGLLGLPTTLSTTSGLPMILALVATAMQVAAAVMLFRADTKPWFGGKGTPESDAATFD